MSFEKKYYESPIFWEGEMLQDSHNFNRIKFTADLIPETVQSILDAGCGNGVFVNYLQQTKTRLKIHALDRSEKALEYVKTSTTLGDVSKLPFDDNSFDCVTCLEVIEHLPNEDYELSLNELTRVAKKYVIVSVPLNENLEDSYTRCPSCKSIFNYELHLRSFKEDTFINLLRSRGFKNKQFIKAGASTQFKFHKFYRKIFYPEQFLKWNSPICPLCGYEGNDMKNFSKQIETQKPIKRNKKLISYFTFLPKLIWPKEVIYYWIIGIFEKSK